GNYTGEIGTLNVFFQRNCWTSKVDRLLQKLRWVQRLSLVYFFPFMLNDFVENVHPINFLKAFNAFPDFKVSFASSTRFSKPLLLSPAYKAIAALATTTAFCASVPLPSSIVIKIFADSSTVCPPFMSSYFNCDRPRSFGAAIFSPSL